MKKYNIDGGILYVGVAREIANLFKNFSIREIHCPVFGDSPKFNMAKVYGLVIDEGEYLDMTVVNSDTALRMIANI